MDRVILLFGTRLRRRTLGAGTFLCPYCAAQREFDRQESRTWIHVFWIPLVPLGRPREAVQCRTCHGEWDPGVAARPAARGWPGRDRPATA